MLTEVIAPFSEAPADWCFVPTDIAGSVAASARTLVERHPCFHGRTDRLDFVQTGRVLTIRGSVPSFYLKQMLQTVLGRLDGIARIDNQVDVVSNNGLSSVRK